MNLSIQKMDIDLVYLWVDGNDPKWIAKRNAFLGNMEEVSELNCKGRYADNDELKYSLRSVEKYAPWIRKIFIVTNEQTPDWLNLSNSKIKIIDHKDIVPQENLPCFNPRVVEYFLYRIPDLSEHFIYANDDMFFNRPVSSSTFFAADSFPIIRLNHRLFGKWRMLFKEKVLKKSGSNHYQAIRNARELVKKKYAVNYGETPHHNMDAYLKSDWKKIIEQIFKDEFSVAMANNLLRSSTDIERVIYAYIALNEKHGHMRHTSREESFIAQIHKESHYQKLAKYNPMLFCLNDSQHAQDSDRMRAKTLLDEYFPDKSEFEK